MTTAPLPSTETGRAPFVDVPTLDPQVVVEARADGTLLLKDPRPLGPVERSIIVYLRFWSQTDPDRLMLAERGLDGEWTRVTYGAMRDDVDRLAQGLLDRGLRAGQTMLILSGNSIEHATLALAAMTIGVAVAPVSPAYSLGEAGAVKLAKVFESVRPSMIFVQSWRSYSEAIARLDAAAVPVLAVSGFEADDDVTAYADLFHAPPGEALEIAYGLTDNATVAKILFSSGSTGWPKGVINSQATLCVNMAMVDAMWAPDEQRRPYVTLNWMPWNHTMAGNGLFNRSLRQGGAYYIDDGRPLPGEFDKTIRNLRDLTPHSWSDVPAGYAMLTSALEEDAELAKRFFSELVFVQYAGASLPFELWERFQAVAVKATGRRIPFLTGYGYTESGPLLTQLYWPVEGSGYIGIPVPGLEVKLIPVDDTRFEVRARGPNLTPGYLGEPELTAALIDDEGFYRTGDAVTFVDRNQPILGLRFASRVAEDFKLLTGTFVAVGHLRAALVGAMMPLVTDLVVTGHDRAFIGALIWPDIAAARRFLNDKALSPAEIVRAPRLVQAMHDAVARYNLTHTTSSTRIDRIILLDEPPSPEANEITEKGYVNQRAVLERRAPLVERLYAKVPQSDVIVINQSGEA